MSKSRPLLGVGVFESILWRSAGRRLACEVDGCVQRPSSRVRRAPVRAADRKERQALPPVPPAVLATTGSPPGCDGCCHGCLCDGNAERLESHNATQQCTRRWPKEERCAFLPSSWVGAWAFHTDHSKPRRRFRRHSPTRKSRR